jgi:hypothetical protein
LAVRPVVSLKSYVTVEDLSISSSESKEDDWTTLPNINYDDDCALEYGEITE